MSEHERQRARERAELEAEFARLDTTYEVLSDMVSAAASVVGVCESDLTRMRQASRDSAQVHREREVVWDRLLDYEFSPESAARIRAGIAERKRTREAACASEQRRAGVERSR